MASFPDLLACSGSDGDLPALVSRATRWTRAELRSLVDTRVKCLRAQGLESGDVVLAPDSPVFDLILMQFALLWVGAALLPYRLGSPEADLKALVRVTGCEWHWFPGRLRLEPTRYKGGRATESLASPYALLVKTSGSTGVPKVAMLTADNLLASAANANARLGFGPSDLWLGCLRMTHVGGISIPYRTALGRGAVLQSDGFDATKVDRLLRAHPVTHISLVPPMLARLLELNPSPPPQVRAVLLGGQAAGRVLVQRAVDAGWPLHLSYGMTETGSQVAITERLIGDEEDCRLAGFATEGVEVDAVACGEDLRPLRLRGPMVMAGYANPDRAPGLGLDDGWLRTADLACVTPRGEIKILGRVDDVAVVGGTNVPIRAVEERLSQVPGLQDIVVIGLDDPIWGAHLMAVYDGDLDEVSLDAWCSRHLEGAQCPRSFLRVPNLPLLDSGKYDRLRIRELAAEAFWSRLERSG